MDSVKIAYIVSSTTFQIVCIVLAFLAANAYSVFWIALMIMASMGMTQRINSWKDFGNLE